MLEHLKIVPPVIAHRGASGHAPENTLSAFSRAAQLGIKWVEFDVVQVSCDELVVFHDETLERTTNGSGAIFCQTYKNLRRLDAGSWFDTKFSNEYIPTLKDVLSFLAEHSLNANIELKVVPGQEIKMISKVLAITEPFMKQKRSIYLYSSFSIDALYCLREKFKTCLMGLLLHEWLPNWREMSDSLNPVSIHVNQEIIEPLHVEEIKKMGKELLCYTVNDATRAKQLYGWGVDALFSDYPDRILQVVPLRE